MNFLRTYLQDATVDTHMTSDHIIKLSHDGKTLPLRHIGYRDAESDNRYEFLTNNFRLAARTIADIYKNH